MPTYLNWNKLQITTKRDCLVGYDILEIINLSKVLTMNMDEK